MISKHQQISMTSSTAVILALFIMVAVISLSNRYFSSIRLDLTENKIYTLSQGTQNILEGLKEPINLTLFYSSKLATQLPGIGVYADRVRDLLLEYQRIAGSNIHFSQIDPQPFSEDEDLAVAHGLSGVPIDQTGSQFYFGLVGSNSIDGMEVISFFTPEREQQLEYDLSQIVQKLSIYEQSKVGILTTLPVNGDASAMAYGVPSQPWYSLQQLTHLHQIDFLNPELESLELDFSLVLVIHPSSLSKKALFAVDQYALKGGNVVMFIDPFAESSQVKNQLSNEANNDDVSQSPLNALLSSWGITITASQVVADLKNALRVQSPSSGNGEVIDYPVWFMLNQDNMVQDDPVFMQLGDIVIASAGALDQSENAATSFSPLLFSSDSASLISTQNLINEADPKQIRQQFQPGDTSKIIAARVSGSVNTAFPDYLLDNSKDTQMSDKPEGAGNTLTTLTDQQVTSGKLNAVVFSDTDFLRDQFWVQVQNFLGSAIAIPSAGNGKLIENLVDQMSGSPDLISVRNRGSNNRPFTLIESIRQTADEKFLHKEQELLAELNLAEQTLVQLEEQKNASNQALLNQDQEAEIAQFINKKLTIRKELRQVRLAMHENIESLESAVKIINIAVLPFFILLFGLFMQIYYRRKLN